MIYVVLGMHKSGTTLTSQILHNSGISMVESDNQDVSYDKGNKYERQSVLALNMEILGARDYEVRDLPNPKSLALTGKQRAEIREIIDSCSKSHKDWGFKDPRSLYTYPCWKQELPEHRIVGIFRPPEEIWPRFRWRGLRKRYLNPFWAWQFLSRWVEHNECLVNYMQDGNVNCLLIDYREMMASDIELGRLEKFTGLPLKDMRRKELYRTEEPPADFCLALAKYLMRFVKGKSVAKMMEELSSIRTAQYKQES